MFSLYYCFARKLDQYYKSGKYCQMRESYGLGLLFYKSVTVVSLKYSFLQDLCTRNFCIPPAKLSQMKLSMVERWASNKYKSRTTPSRKIIPKLLVKSFSVQLRTYCFTDVQILQPWQHKQTKRKMCCSISPFLTAKKAEDWELTYTTNTFLFCRNFLDNCKFDRHILVVAYLFKDWKVPVSCSLLNWLKIFLLCIRWRERKHQNHLHQIWYSLHIHVNPINQGKMGEKSTEVISSVFQLTKATYRNFISPI